ncbi:MAG: hypothetical protein JWQ69_2620 [Pseudomonas sp.]|nr:hypothetical protein [Pseudomonas sp.]
MLAFEWNNEVYMDFPTIIHSFEYLGQRVDVLITQVPSGPAIGEFAIKVLLRNTGQQAIPRRASDVKYYPGGPEAKVAGEALGIRMVLSARNSSASGHNFRNTPSPS